MSKINDFLLCTFSLLHCINNIYNNNKKKARDFELVKDNLKEFSLINCHILLIDFLKMSHIKVAKRALKRKKKTKQKIYK